MVLNTQPPEHIDRTNGATLDIHSIFHTVQGEGIFAGRRAVFVRLAGCNLRCPMCDTAYTAGRTAMTVNEVVNQILTTGRIKDLVVITGGEPFRQNIYPLCHALVRLHGKEVQIETNGRLPPQEYILMRELQQRKPQRLFVILSPKTATISSMVVKMADAYKYVVDAKSVADDGLPIAALAHPLPRNQTIARPPSDFTGPVYVQPADPGVAGVVASRAENIAYSNNYGAAADAVLKNRTKQDRRLCVQMHKLAGLE